MMEWMTNFYFIYSMICAFLPCFIYQAVSEMRSRKRGKRKPAIHFVWIFVFLFYLCMVFDVTGAGTLTDVLRHETGLFTGEINLRPFDSVDILFFLNIIMFMPFGFLLPLIWKDCGKGIKTVAVGMLFSLLIEITQLFNFRTSDIDDLLANTCGTLIGFAIWKLFVKISGKQIIGERLKWASDENCGAAVCIILAMAGRFFLYNPYLLL